MTQKIPGIPQTIKNSNECSGLERVATLIRSNSWYIILLHLKNLPPNLVSYRQGSHRRSVLVGHKVRAGDPGGLSQVRGRGIEYKKRHFFCPPQSSDLLKMVKKNEVVLPSSASPPNMVLDNEAKRRLTSGILLVF